MKYLVLQNIRALEVGVRVNLIGIYDTKEMASAVKNKIAEKLKEHIEAKPYIVEVEPNTTYAFQYELAFGEPFTIKGQKESVLNLANFTDSTNSYLPFDL